MSLRSLGLIVVTVALLACEVETEELARAPAPATPRLDAVDGSEEPEAPPDPRATQEARRAVHGPGQVDGDAQVERDCELGEAPPGFVDLAVAIPSALIVMGYHRADNFTGAPLPGYEAAGAWLEAQAAAALTRAAASLEREGLRLIVHDAYRPRRASEAMVEWCRAQGREDLLHGWVAARSVHNRGRAVDLGLADGAGVALDMGGAWDEFHARSRVRGVDGPPLERRLRLRRALVEAGFEPYEREWWHFEFSGPKRAPIRDEPYRCD